MSNINERYDDLSHLDGHPVNTSHVCSHSLYDGSPYFLQSGYVITLAFPRTNLVYIVRKKSS